MILYIQELAEKHGYICDTTSPRQESNFLRSKEENKLIANVGVAGVINYFITTPMTTVALVIGPKISIPKELLCKRGWPGWFDLIWLDYCGKVSSGNVGKQRKHDLEMIFSSGMLAGKRSKNNDESSTNSKCNASCYSVLAITMSNRATPLR